MCVCHDITEARANIASCLYIVQVGTCCPNTNRVDATDHARTLEECPDELRLKEDKIKLRSARIEDTCSTYGSPRGVDGEGTGTSCASG